MRSIRSRVLVSAAAVAAILAPVLASAAEPRTYTERVQFPEGATRTVPSGSLGPGEARNYLVHAREKQFLTVTLLPRDPGVHYNVFEPGGSMLYESVKGGSNQNHYGGQLYKRGDYSVTVYNIGNRTAG